MAVGQETKRKIIELYFTQHKNIREIAKEVQKSSRDVVAMVKDHKQKLQQSQPSLSAGDGVVQQIEEASELFVKGSTPLQVVTELRLSEEDTTRYYVEYLRLKKLPNLGSLLERLRVPEKTSAFIELTNLAFAEHMRASHVIQLLKMANSLKDGMFNIEENIKKYRWTIAHLRETRRKQGIEMYDLDNKIRSANDLLKQLNLVIKMRNEELAAVLDKKIKYELMAEQFMANNNKMYTKIQTTAKDKVNAFLTEYKGRKLLEFALAAVVESIRQRQDPHRELLFKSTPPLKSYDYDPEKVFYLNTYDYSYSSVIEKVLGPASEIYDKLANGLTDLTISTIAGLERYSYPSNTNFS
jgi:hypothetical protein